jgi:exonuclease VII small subunit
MSDYEEEVIELEAIVGRLQEENEELRERLEELVKAIKIHHAAIYWRRFI